MVCVLPSAAPLHLVRFDSEDHDEPVDVLRDAGDSALYVHADDIAGSSGVNDVAVHVHEPSSRRYNDLDNNNRASSNNLHA